VGEMSERKITLYLETTIPSYLAARTPTEVSTLTRYIQTQKVCDRCKSRFDIHVSEIVLREISRGDDDAAIRRAQCVSGIPALPVTPEVVTIARLLVSEGVVPAKWADDAAHLAVACYHGMEIICTWNIKHMANETSRRRLRNFCKDMNLVMPRISTPEELLESDQ